jgi:hypothetical protein
MSSLYDSLGHQRFREYAVNTFTVVALINGSGSEETRIDVTSDSRMINSPDPSTNPLTYQFRVDGYGDDIDPPVTIVGTELYESIDNSIPIGTDTAKDATIEAPGDELTISHEQEIPPQ